MTSSRQGGSPLGGSRSDIAPPAAAQPPDADRALLASTLEDRIIPRLLQAHAPETAEARAPALPDLPAPPSRAVTPAEVCEMARRVLLADDRPARAHLDALQARGIPVETLFTDLLTMTARCLGEWWEQDTCTFADVTVGVGRLQQMLRDLSHGLRRQPQDFTQPRRILLLPSPGEQHTFGLTMVADFFHAAGWEVSGGPLPAIDAVAAVGRDWFDVMAFSLAGQVHLPRLGPTIAAVRKASLNPQIGVLVGGPMFLSHPGLAGEVGADAVAVNGSLAPEIAEKLVKTCTTSR